MSKSRIAESERPRIIFPILDPETQEILGRVMAKFDNLPVDPVELFDIQSREARHALLLMRPKDSSIDKGQIIVGYQQPRVNFPSLGPETQKMLKDVMAPLDYVDINPRERFQIQSRQMLWVIDFTHPETRSK
jgi:hypothetical protein